MGKNMQKYLLQIFPAIFSIALLPSSRFNLHVYFRIFCEATNIEMPSLNRNKNLMSSSSLNFVIKIYQVFTLYVNIETLNTECKSDQ